MSFYKFKPDDIINIKVATQPSQVVELNGNRVTGSVYLENQYLTSDLYARRFIGFSEREGGMTQKVGPFTASIDLVTAVSGGTNKELYRTVINLYNYYSLQNSDYAPTFTGSTSTTFRVITIPEVYYDRQVFSGSFTGSDKDAASADRFIYDNGRGGLYSGSVSGTLVGHIFYPEGIAVITKGGLTNFGSVSATNFKWKFTFKGDHTIPVQIYRCRAPAGQLNASTNPTFYTVPRSGSNKNQKEILISGSVYITQIGLFNEDYELVGIANLAQPVKKEEAQDILFRLRMDY